ncbi:hypothetical protein QWY75_09250 [Pontixanthobacter aestiaquae]|uniref:Surface-adhesin protein E-like domain-containing protein n=1 Tax=Pontixanthobacter aestiaquae TaxID=1509367 RepID=A0A844Z6C6_9SPHN|nr:surface-adhesin E family protein [Pontixanthobacter aestiaquae]MDN3646384.1 hypothetical protein [Pontixanthobacter aestiaquae]MXO82627.1 hypothetical protein [Pontixanthobacter aestiaquae]
MSGINRILHLSAICVLLAPSSAAATQESDELVWEAFAKSQTGNTYLAAPQTIKPPQAHSTRTAPFTEIWIRTEFAETDEAGTQSTETLWYILCDEQQFMMGSIYAFDAQEKILWSDHKTGYHKRKNYEPIPELSVISQIAAVACAK